MAAERLQKILAAAGISSRRKAEELIAQGHVSVNGTVVTELGTKADSRMDEIRVDGEMIGRPERHVYFMLYKPKGCVTTLSDPEGRPTISDLIKGIRERVFPVGRLDYMSEGLLLLTNDGDLMAQLTHAKTHVPKTYMVKVSGHPDDEQIDRLRAGINLPPEPGLAGVRGKKQPGVERRSFAVKTAPAEIDLVRDQENPWYQVTLIEGRNRQIRRMFEEIGFHIEKIKRIRYGTLELNVEPGELRQLTFGEINELRKSAAKPYRIQPPRPKEDVRRPRTSKAARRGFPKPEREDRNAKRAARPAAPRPAFPRSADRTEFPAAGATEFRERPQRTDSRPPRREAAEGSRPNFERKGFAPRKDSGERRVFRGKEDFGKKDSERDRVPGSRPPKRFTPRDSGGGEREFRGPEGRSRRPAQDTRGERPRYGARPSRSAGDDFRDRAPRSGSRDARPPRREFSSDRNDSSPRKTFGARKPGFGPGKPPKRFDREDSFDSRAPRGDRPPREGGFRGPDSRSRSDRPPRSSSGPRSGGAPRSDSRNSGPRGGGTRPGGPRPGGSRSGGPRPGGSRPGGSRGGEKGPRPGFRRD
jgi:23S rRNA pseudouridine2605 synthase